MEVFHKLPEVRVPQNGTVVAIGNFDGVHRGHVELIKRMLENARLLNATPTVLTFFPHPVEILNPTKKLERLTTTSEKLELLSELGVECVLVEAFTKDLALLSPAQFFEQYLIQGLRARAVHVGFNFMFGNGRSGTPAVLEQLANKAGIHVQIEPPFSVENLQVSSSTIRHFVREGEIEMANHFLGRPYSILGQVFTGDNRGSRLGFPTANLKFASDKIIPKTGVYTTQAIWKERAYLSVTNIGMLPTFKENEFPHQGPVVETHFLDFNTQIYNEWVNLKFLIRLRDERKFDSPADLIKQIREDIQNARRYGEKMQ